MRSLALLVVLSLSFFCGCRQSRGSRNASERDGGGETQRDFGIEEPRDAGSISFDLGPRRDMAVAGPDLGGGGSGSCRDTLAALPSTLLPRCESTTRDAIGECTLPPTSQSDIECVGEAIDSDSMPGVSVEGQTVNCTYCVSYLQTRCFQLNGCSAEVGDYQCCIEENGCMTQNCVSANCSDEMNALSACVGAESLWTRCFGVARDSQILDCFE